MLQAEVFEAHSVTDLKNQLHFWLKEKGHIKILCATQSEQQLIGPMGFRITLTVFYEPTKQAG